MVIGWDGEFILGYKNKFKHLYLGDYNDDLDFEYGVDTSLNNGCAATLMGQFWYFGGSEFTASGRFNNRQVNA